MTEYLTIDTAMGEFLPVKMDNIYPISGIQLYKKYPYRLVCENRSNNHDADIEKGLLDFKEGRRAIIFSWYGAGFSVEIRSPLGNKGVFDFAKDRLDGAVVRHLSLSYRQ